MKTHTQCRLTKGSCHQVTWIPSDHARVGANVSLKTDGEWDHGWIIEEVGNVQSSDLVEKRANSTRKTPPSLQKERD